MFKKNHIIYLILAASTLSCGKKFLDRKPIALAVDETFYKTADDITAAINAAYDPLGWETDDAGAMYGTDWFFGDICSDDARKGGGGESDIATVHALETFTSNSADPSVLLVWNRSYIGIYRANLVIKNAPNSDAPQTLKDRVVGEAKFLRAYYHHNLVKIFGDVPMVDRVLEPSEFELSRTPKATVYAFIESDLRDAASVLPHKGAIEVGRATRGAALGLLARVALYQTAPGSPDITSKWQTVFDNCKTIIDEAKYGLELNYADIHSVSKENGIESLFEIQNGINAAGPSGNWANGNEGTLMNVMFRGRANGGWGFNIPTKDLLNEFKKEKTTGGEDDPRLKATIIQNGDVIFGEPPYETNEAEYPYTGTYTRKYVEPLTAFGANQSDGPSNPRIIRYADILLMYAEAANELGNTSEALAKLKMVRDRVSMPEITETNKDLLRTIIWRERRVELAMENLRFFDLVRQGRVAQVMKATVEGTAFTEGVHEVFPLPATEVDISKGKLVQNNGY